MNIELIPPPASIQRQLTESFRQKYEAPPSAGSLTDQDGVVYLWRQRNWVVLCQVTDETPGDEAVSVALTDEIIITSTAENVLCYVIIAHFGLDGQQAPRLLQFMLESLENFGWEAPLGAGTNAVKGHLRAHSVVITHEWQLRDLRPVMRQLDSDQRFVSFWDTKGSFHSLNRSDWKEITCTPTEEENDETPQD